MKTINLKEILAKHISDYLQSNGQSKESSDTAAKMTANDSSNIYIISAMKEAIGQAQKDIINEYEEKLRWIPVEEKYPEFNKLKYPNGDYERYEVKYCTGGMSPRYFIQISHLIREDKFSGEFDWTQATHWRRVPFL